MLENLNQLLSQLLGVNVEIVSKQNFNINTSKKFFSLGKGDFFFIYEGEIPFKKLYSVKLLLEKILEGCSKQAQKAEKYEILLEEIEKILKANELFFERNKDLKTFFSFLDREGVNYTILENDKVIINKNIDNYTLQTTVNKLKKVNQIDIPIREGELFALRTGFYIIIVESSKKIDSLIKDIIKARLLWLNALYEAKYLYEIDELTGLYTRRKFLDDLNQFENSSFIFINIKNFKTINQLYTVFIGDELLKEFARRLKNHFNGCRIYRLYGDRFVIVCGKDVENYINIFNKNVATSFLIFNHFTKEYLKISPKFQLTIFTKFYQNILEKAVITFKKFSEDIIFFEEYVKPLLEKEEKNLNILSRAIQERNIVPFFQRVIDIKTRDTAYFEILLRIYDNGKYLSPSSFLELAKEKGMYHRLSSIIVSKAVESQRVLNKPVSINVDIYDILQGDFLTNIKETISKYLANPEMFRFEILETEDIYKNIDKVKNFINQIKELDCSVALDDFGKGYSNFIILSSLNIDSVKIDMSLIKNITKDEKMHNIVKSIVSMIKKLGFKATAEGVENSSIFQAIKKLGVDYAQGYYIDKPKRLEEIITDSSHNKF